MSLEMVLIVVLFVVLLNGGGFYGYGRYRGE